MQARTLVVVALLTTVGACGGNGGGGPTTPSAPMPTLPGLSITPATDLIKIKASETFTANATFSDGSSRSVQATWGSDNLSLVAIDSTGRATGVAPGLATIYADYQGMRATRLLRVVPDYQGTWQGDFSVTGCRDEGDWTGVCQQAPNGTLWALTLGITQTRDSVTGTTDPYGDDLPGPVSGTIRQSGHLVVSGTYTITIKGDLVEITVSNWETITTDNERMTGRYRVTTRVAGLQGSVYHDGELRNVTKTSATPLMAVAEASVGLKRDLLLTRGR
jgi:hypothetical protein